MPKVILTSPGVKKTLVNSKLGMNQKIDLLTGNDNKMQCILIFNY